MSYSQHARFRHKVGTRVADNLRSSVERVRDRDQILKSLFENILCPVEEKHHEYSGLPSSGRYYEVVAQHVADSPEFHRQLCEYSSALWSNLHFSVIYCCLFYLALASKKLGEGFAGVSKTAVSVFLRGANAIFRADVNNYTSAFGPVYKTIKNDMLSYPSPNPNLNVPFEELYRIVTRHFFYYEAFTNPMPFVDALRPPTPPATPLYDVFVCEIIDMWTVIDNESVLTTYIECLIFFEHAPLQFTTKFRIHNELNHLLAPGGPDYWPRAVRHKAREMIDRLSPRGRLMRKMIHTAFRLFHPLECMRSVWAYLSDLSRAWVPAWASGLLHPIEGTNVVMTRARGRAGAPTSTWVSRVLRSS